MAKDFGVHVDERKATITYKRETCPLAGAVGRVETAGEIDKRITITRLVALNIFAIALRKKKDKRELYLTVEGDGFAWLVDVDPKLGKQAREHAARITAAGSRAQPAPAPNIAPTVGSTSVADELTKLSDLRAAGVLSDDEFAAQKQRLLG